nr:MAG TPA: hypothetical protein [Caudoviricetes sp.]
MIPPKTPHRVRHSHPLMSSFVSHVTSRVT